MGRMPVTLDYTALGKRIQRVRKERGLPQAKAVFCDDLAKLTANATDTEIRAIVRIAKTTPRLIREEYREKDSWE